MVNIYSLVTGQLVCKLPYTLANTYCAEKNCTWTW